MTRHRYTYEIQYQEVDANRRLRLYTLENYLLNVFGRASDDQGIGIKYLYPQGLTWIITSLSLELSYLPTHGEFMTIETWIERDAHLLSVRNFRIYLLPSEAKKPADGLIPNEEATVPEQSVLIGQGKSVWAVLDLQKREIASVFEQPAFQKVADGEPLSIPRAERMKPILTPTCQSSRKIVYSDVDYNAHCNSCKYLEIMLDIYRPTFDSLSQSPMGSQSQSTRTSDNILSFQPTWRLDINYSKELHLGSEAVTLVECLPTSTRYQLRNSEGETCCNARISHIAQL